MFFYMLDQLPGLELSRVKVGMVTLDFIKKLAKKSVLKTKQDLFKVLEIKGYEVQEEAKIVNHLYNLKPALQKDISILDSDFKDLSKVI